MSKFEEFLQDSFGEHEPMEIDELILDNLWENKESFTEEEKSVLEKYKGLIHLSINKIGLKSLTNMPNIKNLDVLSLNNNNLDGNDLDIINKLYPFLHKIKLKGNKIENIENFEKLKNCTKLKKLEVKDNPFSISNNKYKDKLFEILPNLIAIDKKTKEGEEIDSTDYHNEEGEEYDEEDYNEKNNKGKNNEEKVYKEDDEEDEEEEIEKEEEEEDDDDDDEI